MNTADIIAKYIVWADIVLFAFLFAHMVLRIFDFGQLKNVTYQIKAPWYLWIFVEGASVWALLHLLGVI